MQRMQISLLGRNECLLISRGRVAERSQDFYELKLHKLSDQPVLAKLHSKWKIAGEQIEKE